MRIGAPRAAGVARTIAARAQGSTPRGQAPEVGAGARLRDLCVEGGLVMRAVGDAMVISPPYVITEGELDDLAARARAALDRFADEMTRDGRF